MCTSKRRKLVRVAADAKRASLLIARSAIFAIAQMTTASISALSVPPFHARSSNGLIRVTGNDTRSV
jgi:hypothetical protein